jgi:hypothetical protein
MWPSLICGTGHKSIRHYDPDVHQFIIYLQEQMKRTENIQTTRPTQTGISMQFFLRMNVHNFFVIFLQLSYKAEHVFNNDTYVNLRPIDIQNSEQALSQIEREREKMEHYPNNL